MARPRHRPRAQRSSKGAAVHIPDVLADREYPSVRRKALEAAIRTMLGVPLLREGSAIGRHRADALAVRPFTDKQIELVETFADQAVIAIENARLFEEVQARNRELQSRSNSRPRRATFSRSSAARPSTCSTVLDTLSKSAARLCGADTAIIRQRRGIPIRLPRLTGSQARSATISLPILRHPTAGLCSAERSSRGARSICRTCSRIPNTIALGCRMSSRCAPHFGVPLMRDGVPSASLRFSGGSRDRSARRQIELVTTFADQAVIAIENVRLFEEVQARTRELQESLELPDGDERRAQRHQPLAIETPAGPRHDRPTPPAGSARRMTCSFCLRDGRLLTGRGAPRADCG